MASDVKDAQTRSTGMSAVHIPGVMQDDQVFRTTVRDWIADNFPAALEGRGAPDFDLSPSEIAADVDRNAWRLRVAAQGWGVPTWPREVGGADLDIAQARIIEQEYHRAGAYNPISGIGVAMLGPTVLEYGTPEQIARHVPPIARGEIRWCQGYSEPGAGSDLASLKTSAEDCGDYWLVNGQKVWTSGANHAGWCFCLVRTDVTRKQAGITFLLIDMRSPGVETRPIRLINGESHFCEVFLTDVHVPKAETLGALNGGWTVAKRLLQHERADLAEWHDVLFDLAAFGRRHLPLDKDLRIADVDLRTRLIAYEVRSEAYALTLMRTAAETKAGIGTAPAMSVLKNIGGAVAQQRAELMIEILGADALGGETDDFKAEDRKTSKEWLYSKAFSIFGGSYEIQNNIAARDILGLPIAGKS